ncbi:MAG: beta-eliminating lyase-related protein [Desulfovibrionaceae bacterium]
MTLCTFASDNTSGVHPNILQALERVNVGAAKPYGDDPWTAEAEAAFRTLFGDDIDVFLVMLGTGANTLGLRAMTRPWQAILCSESAHTHTTESGAVEAQIGCKMLPLPTVNGKIRAADILGPLQDLGSAHHSQPRVLALTQATEVATLYSLEELREICDVAHKNGLLVHMDGARIANATAALGGDVRALTRDVGVDMLSFGGTKNGMLCGEAVVIFNHALAQDFLTQRKQCLQLHSKMRFLAAQFLAYFDNDLWLDNARHANAMAARLAGHLSTMSHVRLAHPVQTNGVFAILKPHHIAALQQKYYFYEVDSVNHAVRWMLSYNTSPEQVDQFAQDIAALAL